MKQDAFRNWLLEQGQERGAASSRVSSARRVEQYLGDLDELFAREGCDSVLNRFSYSTNDARAERPNPTPVPIDGDLRTGLASLQQALKLYHSFLTAQTDAGDPFSRSRIEAAMDAFEKFRASGTHAEMFSSFEEPSKYWVRSSKPRQDKRFPTKPIAGFLLGRPASAVGGGWSLPQDAASRLHAAGHIIVDQNDAPLPLPERYLHLMRGAERARLVALNYYIAPAREAGHPSVTIRVGELHDMSGLVRDWASVCQALEGEMFQKLASVRAPRRSGPERSPTTEYAFVLTQDSHAKDVPMPQAASTATTNLILYGPPGTGKTYRTAWEAVRLCLGDQAAAGLAGAENRDQLMAEYRRLVAEGRIEFVTFHQSMSYEEFVEGLRPSTGANSVDDPEVQGDAAGFSLMPTEGVFKRISERARLDRPPADGETRLDRTARVFKVALGRRGAQEDQIRFGLDHGLIHVGWGGDIDWSAERFDEYNEIVNEWRSRKDAEATGHDGNIIVTFSFRADMQIGDYVVLSDGRDRLRAFGRVTSDYYFDQDAKFYPHLRRVEWIWRDDAGTERSRFYPNPFRQHAVYKLNQSLIDWDALEGIVSGPVAPVLDASARAHVLIIDEINRANISKVFGELITLLEPDKRLGRRDEIQLTLPYSKRRFGVPPNLHLVGTMNTADRSIALLDTALRRRFTFRELMPDPSVLSENAGGINLRTLLTAINDRIEYLFDREHQIGHAYFAGCETREAVEDAMRHKVIPLLAEYFYEDWSKVAAVLGDEAQGPSRFLEARQLAAPAGIAEDDFSGGRLRWRVKDEFDFSEFTA